MNRIRLSWCALLVAGLMVGGNQSLSAQDKPKSNNVRQATEDVEEARQQLRDMQKALEDAAQRLVQAETGRKKASAKLESVRTELEEKHASTTGVAKARERQIAAQREFERVSEPVLQRLREQADYKSALKDAQAAAERIKHLRADTTLGDEQRRRLIADEAKRELVPRELEQAALEADPTSRAARKRLANAQAELAAARDRLDALIEKDPALRQAKYAFERARKDIEAAQRDGQELRRKLADAQQRLEREQQQLQKAKQPDRRPRKKGKKWSRIRF